MPPSSPGQDLISQTLHSARFVTTTREAAIRRELSSHLADLTHELTLAGVPEDRMEEVLRQRFGDPVRIGHQLAMTHEPLRRIPWIGDFFYYAPLKWVCFLYLTTLGMVMLTNAWWLLQKGHIPFDQLIPWHPGKLGEILTLYQVTPIAGLAAIGLIQGALLTRRLSRLGNLMEPLILFYLMLFIEPLLYGLSGLGAQISWFQDWPDSISAFAGIHATAFLLPWFAINLIRTIRPFTHRSRS